MHGLQATEADFNDLRLSKLIVMIGKNLVENKMPDSHWFHEVMERGGKIVTIVPEYGPPATKADYWIPVRPGLSDTALLLGVAKALIDRDLVDVDFVKRFTDFPLLVRTDTLKRLRAHEVFAGYKRAAGPPTAPASRCTGSPPSSTRGSATASCWTWPPAAQRRQPRRRRRHDDARKGIDPGARLHGHGHAGRRQRRRGGDRVRDVPRAPQGLRPRHGRRDHPRAQATSSSSSPRTSRRSSPAAIHIGEGINHYFHATLHNRAAYLPLMLTGNIGKHGAGVHTWAGNYKGGALPGGALARPRGRRLCPRRPVPPGARSGGPVRRRTNARVPYDEETSYWGYGDRPLIVDTPKAGRKVFTGQTHMPTPTKVILFNNVNLINNAKWAYDMIKNVNPKVDLIVSTSRSNGPARPSTPTSCCRPTRGSSSRIWR